MKKQDPRMSLNFSAIAKGYAVDVVAEFLKSKGIKNFLVEIGGELVAKGYNSKRRNAGRSVSISLRRTAKI